MTGHTITSSNPPDVTLAPAQPGAANAEDSSVRITMTIGQAGVLAKILAAFDAEVETERSWPPEGYDHELWHDVVVELLTVAGREHLRDLEHAAAGVHRL